MDVAQARSICPIAASAGPFGCDSSLFGSGGKNGRRRILPFWTVQNFQQASLGGSRAEQLLRLELHRLSDTRTSIHSVGERPYQRLAAELGRHIVNMLCPEEDRFFVVRSSL